VAELRILRVFRSLREQLALEPGERVEARSFERTADACGVAPERVRDIVERWMQEAPLRHLLVCRYAAVDELFAALRRRGIAIGVFSDYPAEAKLRALELAAEVVRSATDPDVDRLKPDPRGLAVVAARLGATPEACLVIGDRDDRDGEAARRAGMRFLLRVSREPSSPGHFARFAKLVDAVEQLPGR
jgi:HAD superfamily hydrolase (TIGR01509 family)